jgi:hypothetical protein
MNRDMDFMTRLQELREREMGIRCRRRLCRTVRNSRGRELVTSTTLNGTPDEQDKLEVLLLRLQAQRGFGRRWPY